MAIPQANVNFNGPAPSVQVTIGNALRCNYEIDVYPDSQTQNKQKVAVVGPKDAAKPHALSSVWGNMSSGWKVKVVGGITSAQAEQNFPIQVQLVDGQTKTDFFVVPVPSSDNTSCVFMALIELV